MLYFKSLHQIAMVSARHRDAISDEHASSHLAVIVRASKKPGLRPFNVTKSVVNDCVHSDTVCAPAWLRQKKVKKSQTDAILCWRVILVPYKTAIP
jgi:hypothetical protein